jgi:hypothetical protein
LAGLMLSPLSSLEFTGQRSGIWQQAINGVRHLVVNSVFPPLVVGIGFFCA